MTIQEGQILSGLFQITKKNFARGASGQIHLAKDHQGKTVVLKFVLEGGITKDIEEFKKEYQVLIKFSHPNVARVYHFGEHEGRFFIVYEFIDGKQFHQAVAGMTPEKMVPFFIQGLEGLEAIHTLGMLHLDIKALNILVTNDLKVKIIDFGLAIARENLKSIHICGSRPYMAPEMVLRGGIDNRADLFSFACLMYKCTAGRYPFPKRAEGESIPKLQAIVEEEKRPDPPSRHGSNVPSYLDEIILKGVAKNPDERFGSARAMINALKTHHPEDYKESPEALGSYLIPEGENLIGRGAEQKKVMKSLEELLKGRQPAQALFWINGEEGLGKTHFLKKIKERAERDLEKVSVHFLELPKNLGAKKEKGLEWIQEWIQSLRQKLADNKKPFLLAVDNAERLFADKNGADVLLGLFDLLERRFKNPELFQENMPLLLCLTGKTKSESVQKTLASASWGCEIGLKPFSPEDIKGFLKATPALKHKKIPTQWVEALYHQTEGNPKELMEILREKDSRGLLFDLNGEILVAQTLDTSMDLAEEEGAPEVTQKRLEGSFMNLSPRERECLEWMSVWRWQDLLTGVGLSDLQALIPHNHLLPILNRLVSKNLIIHDKKEGTYAFVKYSYLPGFIYQGMPKENVKDRHQKIYETLQKHHGSKKGYDKAILLHQACGTSKRESLRATLLLGRRLLYEEGNASFAKKLFERITFDISYNHIKLKAFLYSKLIEACLYTGDYEEAKEIYQRIANGGGDSKLSKTLSALLAIAIIPVLIESQQFDQAEARIEQALACFDSSKPDPLVCILLNFKARLFTKTFYVKKGDGQKFLEEAKTIYTQSEKEAQALPPAQKILVRNNDLGNTLHVLGDNTRAIQKLGGKLERLKKNPNIFIEFVTLMTLAEANRFLKKYPEASHYAEAGLKIAQRTRQGKWIQYAHQVMACIHQAKGMRMVFKEKKKAKKEFQLALRENSCCLVAGACLENRQDLDSSSVIIFIRKGQCYQEMGEWNMAEAHFDAALHYQPSGLYLSLATLGLGECYTQKGDVAKARDFLEKALKSTKGLPKYFVEHCAFNIHKAEVRCCLKEKDMDQAKGSLVKMKMAAKKDRELSEDYQSFVEDLPGALTS